MHNKTKKDFFKTYFNIIAAAFSVVVVCIFAILSLTNVSGLGKPGVIDLSTDSFDKEINYTSERSFVLSYFSFFTDEVGNKVEPEGLTVSGDSANYEIQSITVDDSDVDSYRNVTIEYSVIVKSNFSFTKGSDFPDTLGWSGYYNEFFVFDTNTGKILNTDDITNGVNEKTYSYNLVSDQGIYTITVGESKEDFGASYSDWEETSPGYFEFAADDDYMVRLSIRYPRQYDGLAIALCTDVKPLTENIARADKPLYFLEDDNDTIDNYYVIKLSDLISE